MRRRTFMLLCLCLSLYAVPCSAGASRPGLAARLLVSNPSPYVGEEFDLTLELTYSGHPGGRISFEWPGLDQFIAEDLVSVRPQSGRDDRNRLVETLSRRIRPLRSGTLQLREAIVLAGTTSIPLEPVTLRVQPLPNSGKPEGFSDRVGSYRLVLDASGRGPREVRLHLFDDTLLAPVPEVISSIGPNEQLTRIDTETRPLQNGEREHIIRYFYRTDPDQHGALRFTLPGFDPRLGRYVVVASGPAAATTPFSWAIPGVLLLLLSGFGLVLRHRHRRPRSIEGCLQRLCRRPVDGLARDRILTLLHGQLDAGGVEALLDYWQRCDALRFGQQRPEATAPPAPAIATLRRRLWKAIDKQQDIP